jgi:thiamine biosynthesis lipoprotein ApbE
MSTVLTAGTATARRGADWRALGTWIRLVVTEPGRLGEARSILEADLAELDEACSRFRADSELCRLERSAGQWAAISPLLTAAISVALGAAAVTGGDLDPTVGSAMRELGYDRTFDHVPPTGPPVRMGIRRWPSWQRIRFDPQNRRIMLPPGTGLDLGATAKAWAADRAASKLAAALGCGVLVSLGGDIAVAGELPAGGWRIRVQDVTTPPLDLRSGPSAACPKALGGGSVPLATGKGSRPRDTGCTVALHGGGLATSSTVSRRWQRGGDVLHHILDPRTGLPAAAVWRTVSVAARSALDANIASTVAVIRGHGARRWLGARGVAARLVSEAGAVDTLGGWPAEPTA